MLITTETRKVKCMHRFYLYGVSAELTFSNNVRSVRHVMDHYPSNPVGWGRTIDLLRELATERDIKRLSVYCTDSKYDRYWGDDDLEIYESWVSAFQGENLYYLIRYGISGHED